MRLKEVNLIKYGKFTDKPLLFSRTKNDFHVIVGPNEAGKSTVRTAISELLFGMKLQTPFDFLHNTTELRLGGVLESGDSVIVFQRARGRNSLRSSSDEKLPDDHLSAFLDGANKEFFEQMFGLDHERLVEGGKSILDASDKLGQVLFESAAGVGSLGPVREALESRAGELWAPRRNSSEFALAEATFHEAVGELKVAQVRTRDWVEKKEAFEAVNQEIEQTRSKQIHLEILRSKLERIRRLAPFLTDLNVKNEAMAELGNVVDFPPTAYTHLLKAQGDIATEKKVMEERKSDLATKLKERDALKTDSQVLELASDIEALDRLRGTCVNYPRDLPLRQADIDRHLAAAYSAAMQLGWPTTEDNLRAALPGALALKTVTNLLHEHGALQQALASANGSLEEKNREITDLSDQLRQLPTTAVPDGLHVALAVAQGFRNSGTKEQSLERDVATAERLLSEALDGLGRWRMPVQELRKLNLLSPEQLSALQKAETERESAVTSAREALEKSQEDVERLLLKEKHFTENNKVVTAAEVLVARKDRDGAWGDIKKGAVGLEIGAPAVDRAILLADRLVDSQLDTTQATAELQALRQQIEVAQADLARKNTSMSDRLRELETCHIEWESLTTTAGVAGMPLFGMAAWLAKRDTVFVAQSNLELKKNEFKDVQAMRVDAQAALLSALRAVSLGRGTDELAALIAIAESFVQSASRVVAQQETLADQVRQAERTRAIVKEKVAVAQTAYDDWNAQWRVALAAAKLTEASPTLAAAQGAVELANSIAADFAAAEDPRNRILAMQADLFALETDAGRLADALAPELKNLGNWLEVASRLMIRLTTAKEGTKAIERADDAIGRAKSKVRDAETTVAGAEARVRPVLQLASVDSIELALPLAERSDHRRALLRDIVKLNEVLSQDGDGLSQNTIAAEVAEHDIAQVPALLEKAKQDLVALGDDLNKLMQRQVTAKQAFEAIGGQANAALAEAKRQEAIAAMGEAAEQYLEAATASRLLKWATDRYRDQKQGPMLKRAGEIFAGLTLGEFSRLTVDTEKNPPALYAKRRNGKSVEVIGLSEGTRDQLFLALRIAALELQLGSKAALPFIADDLFINFDDERAKAGLEALRDLSLKTQVLFLTHHDHLLPLVKEVFGETVNIEALEREQVVYMA